MQKGNKPIQEPTMSTRAILSRLSTLQSKLKSTSPVANFLKPTSPSNNLSASAKSAPRISRRLPVEASCLLTMLPLHSAIASARLQSVLSVDSESWCLVPQGMSMPL